MSEFGEPVSEDGSALIGSNGSEIAAFPIWTSAKIRERIAACVNACAGIPTDELSQKFREFAAALTGVSIENDPRSVPPAKPFGGLTPDEAIRRLREAGMSAWDQFDDPEAALREIRGEEPGLQWRKEPPDKPGLWWLKRPRFEAVGAMVYSHNGEWYVLPPGVKVPLSVGDSCFVNARWAGPIEPPPFPETTS